SKNERLLALASKSKLWFLSLFRDPGRAAAGLAAGTPLAPRIRRESECATGWRPSFSRGTRAMLPRRDAKPLDQPALLPMFGGMEKNPRFLDREVVTMGRARGSDFCLDGNEVSALHCIIYRAADGFRVRDCGSRTGTRVNGQTTKNSLLANGD